ncbi:MAG TPA: LPXTG cell wall anchor domain-containing protein [Natronosporangium sp.]
MAHTTLRRRLLAGVAGLAIGLSGALALSLPAQATGKFGPPAPTWTQPTCEEPGSVTIPAEPKRGDDYVYELNGQTAERGKTYTLEPGEHEVKVYKLRWKTKLVLVKTFTKTLKKPDCPPPPEETTPPPPEETTPPVEETTPPVEETTPPPAEETTPPEETAPPADEGEGGELPRTGNQAVLFGVGALVMLAVGGAMYLVARRRRITFTA